MKIIRENIIRETIEKILYEDFKLDDWKEKFKREFQDDISYRVEYSIILKIIEQKNDVDVMDKLYQQAEKVKVEILSDEEIKKEFECLYIIIEHILLEIPRIQKVRKIEVINKNMDKQFDQMANIKNDLSGRSSEIIAIMSIFSAVIIAFFGGMNMLSGAMASMENTNKYKLIIIIIIIGIIMFNVIYLLLKSISVITKKPFWGEQKKCESCIEAKDIRCMIKENKILVYYNVANIYGLLNVTLMYVVDKYNIATLISNALCVDYRKIIMVGELILYIGIVLWSGWKLILFIDGIEKSCKCELRDLAITKTNQKNTNEESKFNLSNKSVEGRSQLAIDLESVDETIK